MKCTNCSAALNVEQMRGEDCPFCGIALEHRAEAIKSTATVKEMLRDSDGDGVPDIFGDKQSIQDRIDQQRAAQNPYSVSPRVGLLVVVAIFVVAIGAGLFFDRNDPLSLGVHDLRLVTKTCMVQANGDETLDVAVFAPGSSYDGARIALFDGKDGSQLFKSERLEGGAGLSCLDESAFLVYFSDFRQQIYLPKKPEEVLKFTANDTARAAGRWRDCVRVQTADGGFQSYSLSTGQISECEVPTLKPVHDAAPNVMTLTQDETNWKRASVRASLTMTKPGSPRLQVGYEGGDDTRWKTQLDFLKPTFSSAIETFPGRVMVWGASLGKRDECFLIALDDATGEVAYTVPFPQPTANQINFFLWNGDFLLVGFGGGLWAIDPATGEKAWTLGSTGMGRTIDSSQMGQ
jgi:hypothetical protein